MTEKKRKFVVYTICCVAVIWAAFNYPAKRRVVSSAQPPSGQPAAQAAVMSPIAASSPDDTLGEAEWGRDPFARGGYSPAVIPEGAPGFHISAVSEAGGNLMAIINGNLVSKGEQIDGWLVTGITKTEVTLEHNDKRITVKVAN